MKTSFLAMSKWQYPLFILLHPFDGFSELKYNKKGSMGLGVFLVILWYIGEVFSQSTTDFAFNISRPDRLDLRLIALLTIALFLIIVISNWCFSTFMDGKGTLSEIFIAGAYCLIPLIVSTFLCTMLSHALVADEKAFLTGIQIIGVLWTVFLVVAAVQEIHDFNFFKAIAMLFLTALGMIVMLFLGFLVYSLAQQVIMFVVNITYELIYRITMG